MVHPGSKWLLCSASALVLACEAGPTKYIGSHDAPSTPDACAAPVSPPEELALDPFYAKYVDAAGVPVIASSRVPDTALGVACETVVHMLSRRDDVRVAMLENQVRVGVIASDERLTELPEYRDLYQVFPERDWDVYRGVGATLARPVSSVGAENLLCAADDDNGSERILVHTFAHAIRSLGLLAIDAEFDPRLESAYADAMASGRFADTFAATDHAQYWAEGVQSWFDANDEASPPDGLHNEIDTRAELRSYDPALADLIGEVLPDDAWRPACP